MVAFNFRWLLLAVPIPWAISDEFYTIRITNTGRVHAYEMHPELNPTYPKITSWLEDDYLLIRRTNEDSSFKDLKGRVILLRNPEEPKKTTLSRLTAVEGDWVNKSEFFRLMVPMGHGYFTAGEGQDLQVPLALVEGVATHVLWPPGRYRELPART